MTPNAPAHQWALGQLDLFLTQLPICGRGGPCQAVVESGQYCCITCNCVAPRTTALDDFFKAIVNAQSKFLQQQASPPDDPANDPRDQTQKG